MTPLSTKLKTNGLVYKAVIEKPAREALVRIYCDGEWIGIGKVKKYPDCKITGAIRKAYGETMRRTLRRLSKRLTKKAMKRIEKAGTK